MTQQINELAAEVLQLCRERGLMLATAESCTGGKVASTITSIAGSSDVFLGAVVSYANDVKRRLLGVCADDLANYGAVSQQVVRQMAEGVSRVTRADCSVATSGVAGPGGGTKDKPVGTVWMAVHTPRGTHSWLQHFDGGRLDIINQATGAVLSQLKEILSENFAG